MAVPSTDQEKLDREWEYFETVCDQVYFILVTRLCYGSTALDASTLCISNEHSISHL